MSSKQDLEAKLAFAPTEKERMELLLQLISLLRTTDIPTAEKYSGELLLLSHECGDKFYHATALQHLGIISEQKTDYPLALIHFTEAKKLFSELQLTTEAIFCNSQIGKIYANLGDYSKAVDFFEESLHLAANANDTASEANTLNAFSVVYQRSGNSGKAEELAKKSIALASKTGSLKIEAIARINLGNAYGVRNDWDDAIAEWTASMEIFQKLGDEKLFASALGNLGIAYLRLGQLEKAKENIERCLEAKKRLNDVYDVARSIHNLGTVYWKMGDIAEAKKLYDRALGMGDESKAKSVHVMIIQDYAAMLKDIGDYKAALEMLEKFHDLEKSLFTEEMNVKTQSLQIRFNVERMEKENEIYRLKNIDLAAANELITNQKQVIEQKNKDITDSILYAKRIQEAVLPGVDRLKKWFGEMFVLYIPKDIVSGDFYWATEKDGKFILAVADSTGHGVPGAIMSIMGSSFLSEIIGTQGVTNPGEILNELRRKVISALHQTSDTTENRDGMDIAICSFNLEKSEFVAACANNPVWIIRDGEVDEAEPDKFPVGVFPGEPRPFTNHDTEIKSGDAIYLFTDGFADQFGGPRGKKFGYKQLRELVLANHQLPVGEQKIIMENAFRNWKGEAEQIDDVLLVGIRI